MLGPARHATRGAERRKTGQGAARARAPHAARRRSCDIRDSYGIRVGCTGENVGAINFLLADAKVNSCARRVARPRLYAVRRYEPRVQPYLKLGSAVRQPQRRITVHQPLCTRGRLLPPRRSASKAHLSALCASPRFARWIPRAKGCWGAPHGRSTGPSLVGRPR